MCSCLIGGLLGGMCSCAWRGQMMSGIANQYANQQVAIMNRQDAFRVLVEGNQQLQNAAREAMAFHARGIAQSGAWIDTSMMVPLLPARVPPSVRDWLASVLPFWLWPLIWRH